MPFHFPLLLILFSLSIPSLGETMDDLVKREGLYYKKFTDVPFTGEVEGKEQGSFKDGKRDGPWISYWNNGQLCEKGDYKDGVREGPWVFYYDNGNLWLRKNYEDGKIEGPYKLYHPAGQIWLQGRYKDGRREGLWVGYHADGSRNQDDTGMYKNGVKIND